MPYQKPISQKQEHLAVIEETKLPKRRKLLTIADLGAAVRNLRNKNGTTRLKLAKAIGSAQSTLHAIEVKEARIVDIFKIDKIAEFYGIKLSEFIASIEDPSNRNPPNA